MKTARSFPRAQIAPFIEHGRKAGRGPARRAVQDRGRLAAQRRHPGLGA